MKTAALLPVLAMAVVAQIRPNTSGNESLRLHNNTLTAEGATLRELLAIAYNLPENRIAGPAWIGTDRFDVPSTSKENLRDVLTSNFQLTSHMGAQSMDVYVLRQIPGVPPKLGKPAPLGEPSNLQSRLRAKGTSMNKLASKLAASLPRPVLDETGLTGVYDVELIWETDQPASLIEQVRTRLGLQLVEATRTLDVLMVDSARRPI